MTDASLVILCLALSCRLLYLGSHTHIHIQGEDDVLGALSGFGLGSVLGSLDLPSGSGLSSQLGIGGVQDDWDTDGAVGHGEGDDWEDEVNAELLAEQGDAMQTDGMHVKAEARSPEPALFTMKERRVRVVRRLVERPKTVYERFPAFEKDSVLAFTELFKGKVPRKSRISKRPFHGMC